MSDRMDEVKTLAENKKAYHEHTVLEKREAGISLLGTEVKSIKDRNVSLKDGYCSIKNGELYLKNVHISPYPYGNRINHDPLRERKLLLHKGEIVKLSSKINEKGLTVIPLRIYLKKGKVKVELGLCKGKRLHDKKEEIMKKDIRKDLKKDFKLSNLTGKLK